eukprot:4015904-Pyramimonas_sp.AAC.1
MSDTDAELLWRSRPQRRLARLRAAGALAERVASDRSQTSPGRPDRPTQKAIFNACRPNAIWIGAVYIGPRRFHQ